MQSVQSSNPSSKDAGVFNRGWRSERGDVGEMLPPPLWTAVSASDRTDGLSLSELLLVWRDVLDCNRLKPLLFDLNMLDKDAKVECSRSGTWAQDEVDAVGEAGDTDISLGGGGG